MPLAPFLLALSSLALAADPPRAIVDPAQVDADFAFQGEFAGWYAAGRRSLQGYGLQVVALGDGKFAGLLHPGGLPGWGWNGTERIDLTGQRADDQLTLTGPGATVQVDPSQATLSVAGWSLVLPRVTRHSPTLGLAPPPHAVRLFDGTATGELNGAKITPEGWLEVGAVTRQPVGDFQLHVEFRTPYMPRARGQGRGNSGVYIQQRYEVQILDSFGLHGEFNECGSLYRQTPPDVNMCLPPLTWQTYDIVFYAARFDASGKEKTQPAQLTVYHNGVAIHHQRWIAAKTGAGQPEGPTPRPILFQNHSDPVHFRNLWIVDLSRAIETADSCDCTVSRRGWLRRRWLRCD